MSLVLTAIFPIIFMVTVGFGMGRFDLFNRSFVARFSQLTFRFFIPCLLFTGIYRANITVIELARYWSGYFVPTLALFGLLALINSPIFALTTTYANTVMVGIPLVVQTWDQEGLNIAIAVISLNSLTLFFTYTLTASLRGGNSREQFSEVVFTLRNPIILSLIAGVALNILQVPLNEALLDSLELAGRAGVPCALLILGATLTGIAANPARDSLLRVSVLCLLKLLLVPLSVYICATFVFGLPHFVTGVLVILAACPSGINVLPFAQQSDDDRRFVSAGIFASTLLSTLTLPLWVYLVS